MDLCLQVLDSFDYLFCYADYESVQGEGTCWGWIHCKLIFYLYKLYVINLFGSIICQLKTEREKKKSEILISETLLLLDIGRTDTHRWWKWKRDCDSNQNQDRKQQNILYRLEWAWFSRTGMKHPMISAGETSRNSPSKVHLSLLIAIEDLHSFD